MNLSEDQMLRMLEAVSGYCSASPEVVRRVAISHTVERFCRDMGGIRLHLGPVPLNKPDGTYFAVAPFGGVVYDVRCVSVNGRRLSTESFCVEYTDDGRAKVHVGLCDPKSALLMDVLWRPGERTTQMPSQWFDKNFDTIMHGSIAAILSQVGTAWGNPQLAGQFDEEYARDVHDAIYESRIVENRNGQLSCLDPTEHWI